MICLCKKNTVQASTQLRVLYMEQRQVDKAVECFKKAAEPPPVRVYVICVAVLFLFSEHAVY